MGTEIVCVAFSQQGTHVATGSMDNTAKIWDVETGQQIASLEGHTAEIVSLSFNTDGDRILTGSFDNTAKIWEVRTGRCYHTLAGHSGESRPRSSTSLAITASPGASIEVVSSGT